jgi:hypothetical protein
MWAFAIELFAESVEALLLLDGIPPPAVEWFPV